MTSGGRWRWITPALAGLILLGACGTGGSGTIASGGGARTPNPSHTGASAQGSSKSPPAPVSPENPVPVESNPPGDIPDNTQFASYDSKPGQFKISVPDGWSRSTGRSEVRWTDKLNEVTVGWAPSAKQPSVASATHAEIPQLRRSTPAFRLVGVKGSSLPAGPAVLVTYQANSRANPVTGKQYRLVVLRYELFRHGTEAVLTLSSPVGADNVDPWTTISQSFRWR